MLLRNLLISMVLAGIIEYVMWIIALRFFEWRFLQKAEAISFLVDSLMTFVNDNFSESKPVQISVKYNHFKYKIKFRTSLEVVVKIEVIIQRAIRNYKIARYLDEKEYPDEKLEIDEAKEYLEEICKDLREIIKIQEDVPQKEL